MLQRSCTERDVYLQWDHGPSQHGLLRVTYDTTHYGSNPIGEGAACFSSSAGCFYDSLNVGITLDNPSVGSSIGMQFGTEDGVFSPSPYTDYTPTVQFKAGS